MGPYETLATSGQLNVYVAAPERILAPLFPGDLSIVPHYSFAEYDAAFGEPARPAGRAVHPVTADTADARRPDLDPRPGDAGTTILSICGGAKAVADAGVLSGQTATTHHRRCRWSETDPSRGQLGARRQRYVDSGQFISSAGVTSGVDATLYTLGRMFGREVWPSRRPRRWATRTSASRTIRPGTVQGAQHRAGAAVAVSLVSNERIGLVLYDGVRELEVSSVIDTYPRVVRHDRPHAGAGADGHPLAARPRTWSRAATSRRRRRLDRLLVPG